MSSRPILCGISTVEVDQNRYDELLHKEEQLNTIKRLYTELSSYSFHDVVGHLFKVDAVVEADE